MLIDRLGEERGNVIVTAILVLAIMMAIGLAALSRVDGQTQLSGKERQAESTFNLSEGALTQQSFILGRRGTGTATTPYPPTCGSDAPASSFCPDPAKLALNYDAAAQNDFAGDGGAPGCATTPGAGVAPDLLERHAGGRVHRSGRPAAL